MPIILSIKPQPRKGKVYQLTMDDGRTFSFHEEVIARHSLKSHMELEESELMEKKRESDRKIAFDLALRYLGYQKRTRRQLSDYLGRKGFEPEIIEETAARMEEYRFVNDREYAVSWVESRKRGQPAGRRKIECELKNKGISEEVLNDALSGYTEEEEFRQALRLAEKYRKKHDNLPVRERMAKIGQALQRRGFDWETISRAVQSVTREESAEELDIDC